MGGFSTTHRKRSSRWQGDLGRGSVSAQVGADAPSAGHPEVDQDAVPTVPQRHMANRPRPTTFAGRWKRLRRRMASR